jgi:hypothetical protein
MLAYIGIGLFGLAIGYFAGWVRADARGSHTTRILFTDWEQSDKYLLQHIDTLEKLLQNAGIEHETLNGRDERV